MFRFRMALAIVGALAGCRGSMMSAAPQEAAVYQCVSSDGGPALPAGSADARKGRRLTVSYDAGGQQTLVSVDGGSVNYLNLVPNAKDRLYTNAKYAWKSDGNTNLFTDIADVRVYSCTRAPKTQATTASTQAHP